jgi:hypothetical protein
LRRAGPSRSLGENKAKAMRTRFTIVLVAALLVCGAAQAQAPSISPGLPLGITSPLGIGPSAPVGPTRIPLGATELATPGASAIISGASPLDPLTGVACGGALSAAAASAAVTSATTGASGSTTFDGGGMGASSGGGGMGAGVAGGGTTASTSGPCAPMGSAGAATAGTASPGSPVGPIGIPMGATEMGSAGLSPPSVALIPNPSAPMMSTLSPLTPPSSNSSASSTPSTSLSPPPCATTQTGVPTISGTATTFGSPLAGRALSNAADRCF